jgi:hypothetical protein
MTIIQVQGNEEVDIGDTPDGISKNHVIEFGDRVFIVRDVAWRYIPSVEWVIPGNWIKVFLCEEGDLVSRDRPEA